MKISNKFYDILKIIAQYIIPALTTCYFTLAQSGFDLPYPAEVVGFLTALDTLLGVLLGLSKAGYSGEGTLVVDTSDEEKDKYLFNVNIPLEELASRKSITMKVENGSVG